MTKGARSGRSPPLSLIVEYMSELNKEIIYNMMLTTLLIAVLVLNAVRAENTVLLSVNGFDITTLHVLGALLATDLAALFLVRERVERIEEVLKRYE